MYALQVESTRLMPCLPLTLKLIETVYDGYLPSKYHGLSQYGGEL